MSPLAPKTTMAQGSAGGTCRRCGDPTVCAFDKVPIGLWSRMALARGVLCRRTGLLFCRSRFGIDGLAALDVAAEAETHRRQHLFCEVMLLPRTESGVKSRGQHVRRHRLLDRGLDGPAAFAGVLDVTGEFIQLRILYQRGSAEIEQPG